jgi:hypothetical protein
MTGSKTLVSNCPADIERLGNIAHELVPRGWATLVSGAACSRKTVLAMEFLIFPIHEMLDFHLNSEGIQLATICCMYRSVLKPVVRAAVEQLRRRAMQSSNVREVKFAGMC